jgi:hypothetical protein
MKTDKKTKKGIDVLFEHTTMNLFKTSLLRYGWITVQPFARYRAKRAAWLAGLV